MYEICVCGIGICVICVCVWDGEEVGEIYVNVCLCHGVE